MTPDLSSVLERAHKTAKVHAGPIRSPVAGRTDHLNMNVRSGAYVLPADIVSALGEGNTLNGFEVAKSLPSLWRAANRTEGEPYGEGGLPYRGAAPKADGGEVGNDVPIVAAGGEHVYTPEEAAAFGNGDLDAGHKMLDEFVKQVRAQTVKTLKALPGPRKN